MIIFIIIMGFVFTAGYAESYIVSRGKVTYEKS